MKQNLTECDCNRQGEFLKNQKNIESDGMYIMCDIAKAFGLSVLHIHVYVLYNLKCILQVQKDYCLMEIA